MEHSSSICNETVSPPPQNTSQPLPTTASSGPDYTWIIILVVGVFYYLISRKK